MSGPKKFSRYIDSDQDTRIALHRIASHRIASHRITNSSNGVQNKTVRANKRIATGIFFPKITGIFPRTNTTEVLFVGLTERAFFVKAAMHRTEIDLVFYLSVVRSLPCSVADDTRKSASVCFLTCLSVPGPGTRYYYCSMREDDV